MDHSSELAAMLLRDRQGLSVKGQLFTDFVPTLDESERAEELLRRFDTYPPESINTQAFHTRMVDSCSSRFRTEVFQVMHRTSNGRIRHLMGLRDFTDQRSLAGSQAADAMSDTRMSYSLLTPTIFTPNSTLPPIPVTPPAAERTDSDAIEHKRLISLQIDMERGTVAAASKPVFVGKKLTDVFSQSGLEVLERAWVDARSEEGVNKAISFHALELRLNASIKDLVDGILEAVTTETGDLNLMMRCLITPKLAAAAALTRSNSRSLPRLPEATAVQEMPSHEDGPEFVHVNF